TTEDGVHAITATIDGRDRLSPKPLLEDISNSKIRKVLVLFLMQNFLSSWLAWGRTLKINEMLRKKKAEIEAKRIAEEEEAAKIKKKKKKRLKNVEKEVEKMLLNLLMKLLQRV
ncbi:hypothetical protein Tco_1511584, partial [Tanacetum coccineum]